MAAEEEVAKLITRMVGDPSHYLKALKDAEVATNRHIQATNTQWKNSKGQFVSTITQMDKALGVYTTKAGIRLKNLGGQFTTVHQMMEANMRRASVVSNISDYTTEQGKRRLQAVLNQTALSWDKLAAAAHRAAIATAQAGRQALRFTALRLAGRGGAAFVGLAAGFAGAREFGATETALARIRGLSNLAEEGIVQLQNTMQEASRATGQHASALADAAFFVASAGLSASEASEALELSAKGAAAGLGSATDIARTVASAINAYSSSGMTAARATDILAAAVKAGNLETDQLANTISKVFPIASSMGVSMEQVAGILSVFSNTGADAAEATTSLRGILTTLLGTSREGAKIVEDAGLSLAALRDIAGGPGGLIEVFRILNDTFKDDEEALNAIFGNVRAFTGVMNALAQDADKVNTVMETVANSTGTLNSAFNEVSNTVSFSVKQAWTDFVNTLVDLINEMGPLITLLSSFISKLSELASWGIKNIGIFGIWNKALTGLSDWWSGGVISEATEQIEENTRATERNVEALRAERLAQSQAAQATKRATEARREQYKREVETGKKVEEILRNLRFQAQGFSDMEIRLFEMEHEGQTRIADWVFEETKELQKQIDLKKEKIKLAEEEAKKIEQGVESAARRARQLLIQSLDPMQNLRRQIEEVNNLTRAGALTRAQNDRIVGGMLTEFAQAGGTVARNAGQAQILGGGSGATASDFRKSEQVQVRTERGVWEVVRNTKAPIPLLEDIKTNIKKIADNNPQVIKNLEQ